MTTDEEALLPHEEWKSKLEAVSKAEVASREDLALAYTPGVAEPCKTTTQSPEAIYLYAIKPNTITAVSNSSAILGLRNTSPLTAMPVTEGKSVLFREFGGVNASPICLNTQDTEEVIETVVRIAPALGGINLKDIVAPRCFEIGEALKERLDIPVFHSDQHRTAIVVLAGVINTLKVTGRRKEEYRVVVNDAGSAGVATVKLLLTYGFPSITMCDKSGILRRGTEGLNWMQEKMTGVTSLEHRTGSLADTMKSADISTGASAPGIVTSGMVVSMNKNATILTMVNPIPEIMPDPAKATGARVVSTGHSDFPNQVNNVVVFPGIFKGALERRVTAITEEMKLAAANAIAGLVDEKDLNEDNILPEAFGPRIACMISQAVEGHI